MEELRKLENIYPEFRMKDSPTQSVGFKPSNDFEKIKHVKKMYSLDSSDDMEKAKRWLKSVEGNVILCQPKMDGLSIELVYRNGILHTGSTRGDGEIGEDVTTNLRFVTGIPQSIGANNCGDYLVIRGEVYINLKDFHELNASLIAQGNEPFANPRNAAAGSLRQKNPYVAWNRPLRFYPFEIVNHEDLSSSMDEITMMNTYLDGFIINEGFFWWRCYDWDGVMEGYEAFAKQRDNLPFEIDGVVLKITDYKERKRLGTTSKFPKWAYAIKFPPRSRITTIRKVVSQVGRTGKITPVAVLDPVDVSGVTVSRATLHNWDEINRLGIAIGDKVEVARRGDVIPKVERKVEPGKYRRYALIPAVCPSCGQKISRVGANHMCLNMDCYAQMLEKLRWFVSRDAMNIQSLGDQKIKDLFDNNLIRYPSDLYRLHPKAMAMISGWGFTSANKVIEELRDTIGCDLYKVITALGIPSIGEVNAKALAEKAQTLKGLLELSYKDIVSINGIGPKTAKEIQYYVNDVDNYDQIMELNEYIKPIHHSPTQDGNNLEGMVMVFTGSLTSMSRKEAQHLAQLQGAKITGSVSKATDMVVCGSNPGNKEVKARELGILILSEQEFLDTIGVS